MRKKNLIMTDKTSNVNKCENHTEKQTNEFSAETIYAAKIFKQLSPEMQVEILEVLRQLNNTK
ncbi:MAG: hypothetical protein ACI4JS_03305 [Oscillospiraceae bacterium]